MASLVTDSVFGFNVVSLVGFIAMGLGLTLRRMAAAKTAVCFGLMTAGTVLVLVGLYVSHTPA